MARLVAAALLVIACSAGVALTGCATYRDQLGASQRAFDNNEYDRSLAILRDLESNMTRLKSSEQAHYAYLRGMSDYRIGYKSDARHWLSLAKAHEEHSAGVLPPDWKARVNEALDELNGVVYDKGIAALTSDRRAEGEPADVVDAGSDAPRD